MSNDIPHKTRVTVRRRSEGVCERCLARHATDMAHRIPRDVGGHAPSNIAHLCRTCHAWSHNNPEKAYREAWIVRANSRILPGDLDTIPCHSRDGWVLLHHDGSKQQIREITALEILEIYGIRSAVTA